MAKGKKRPQGLVVKADTRAGSRNSATAAGVDATATPTVGVGCVSNSSANSESAELPPVAPAIVGRKSKKRRRKEGATQQDDIRVEDEDDVELPSATSAPAGSSTAPSFVSAQGESPGRPWDAGAGRSATEALQWLLWPLQPAEFFAEYWEKRPLHLRRNRHPDYYGDLFSKATLDRHFRDGTPIPYGERLNLSRFDREAKNKLDLNPGPRGELANASDVEKAWNDGASLQVMHPQQFHAPAWSLLAALEPAFSATVGANAYLTPAGHEGFAPHYDDVEVFMLQMEGTKRWRLYKPPEGEEYPLPREYSRDFDADELGELILDCVLEQGDLLYFPRGTVYAGVVEDEAKGFSHHLTVSTYHKTSWCQVLERTMLGALEKAANSCEELRSGLPVGFLEYMGSLHDCDPEVGEKQANNGSSDRRGAMKRTLSSFLRRVCDFVDLDEVCDELGVDFMAQRLPPFRQAEENKKSDDAVTVETQARWTDPTAVRAMLSSDPETDEATVMLFHTNGNDRRKHMNQAVDAEEDVGCLRFEAAVFLPALRVLLAANDKFVRCGDLPLANEDDRIAFFENLRDEGLLELRTEVNP